ncbi:MAG: NUDIX domain-containing protein [Bacteroidales bacterium]|jgi:NADH pyrophosphatase NudC (nudix superfamily)|nr:NUDIX domain-containing protein [Bacteroidales bacterium]
MNDFFPSEKWRYCPYCGADAFRPGDANYMKCEVCGEKFYINASAAVACIVVNAQKEILLTRRKFEPAKGMLDLPGGFVNADETAEEAVRREIMEELNLRVDAARYFGSSTNRYHYGNMTYFTLDMGFECTVSDFSRLSAADDVASCAFFAPCKVDFAQIGFPSIRALVRRYMQR